MNYEEIRKQDKKDLFREFLSDLREAEIFAAGLKGRKLTHLTTKEENRWFYYCDYLTTMGGQFDLTPAIKARIKAIETGAFLDKTDVDVDDVILNTELLANLEYYAGMTDEEYKDYLRQSLFE